MSLEAIQAGIATLEVDASVGAAGATLPGGGSADEPALLAREAGGPGAPLGVGVQ